jgi:hypothetical protein
MYSLFYLLKNCIDTALLFAQPEEKGIAFSPFYLLSKSNFVQIK